MLPPPPSDARAESCVSSRKELLEISSSLRGGDAQTLRKGDSCPRYSKESCQYGGFRSVLETKIALLKSDEEPARTQECEVFLLSQ